MSASPAPATLELPRPCDDPPALDSAFRCTALHAILPVRVCLLRQAVSARQRTGDGWRGQASDFPSCTARCVQGAELRAVTAGASGVTWRGSGPRGRMTGRGARGDRAAQDAARHRLEAAGMLDIPPSMDEPPQGPSSGPLRCID